MNKYICENRGVSLKWSKNSSGSCYHIIELLYANTHTCIYIYIFQKCMVLLTFDLRNQ